MKTNKQHLCTALGIIGDGCFRTISELTGLSVDEIINLHEYYPADGDNRAAAYMFVGTHRQMRGFKPEFPVTETTTGYDRVMYWRGVLAAMQQKESEYPEGNEEYQSIDPGYFWEELADTEK